MIEVYIYSDNDTVRDTFRDLNKSKYYHRVYLSREELGEIAGCELDGVMIYLDLCGYDRHTLQRQLRFLSTLDCAWGVADPDGIIEDPAEVFHLGGTDYLPPGILQERIKSNRMHRVIEYQEMLEYHGRERSGKVATVEAPSGNTQLIPSGKDWSGVKKGHEYTFLFFYIELLPGEEWKVKSGDKNRQDIQSRFEQCVRRWVTPLNGMIWMWSDWGGVILFPFDGSNSAPIFLAARLMINRPLISIEELRVDSIVDYRLALHVGNTVYNTRGDTGTIISEDLNFFFHLGKRRVEANSLYVTEAAYPQIPQGLQPLFTRQEVFEGSGLYRMRRFVF